jgi:serine/threonine-protein kinase RsbW
MTGDLLLHLRNDARELERVAAEIERFGAAHALAPKLVHDLGLALDEVLTNVIWYAFDDDGAHEIRVRICVDGQDVVIEVEDDGRPFDPLALPPAAVDSGIPLEQRRVGGLGMHLVRRTMDVLAYRRDVDKNVFTMRKRLR